MSRFLSAIGRRKASGRRDDHPSVAIWTIPPASEPPAPRVAARVSKPPEPPRIALIGKKWGTYQICELWLPSGKFRDEQSCLRWFRSQAEHCGVPKRVIRENRGNAQGPIEEIEVLCGLLRVDKSDIREVLNHIR